MKKTAALAAIAALLLAGCSSGRSDTVNAVSDSFQSQDVQTPMTAEDKYLSDIRATGNPDLMDETDSSLLQVGYETCNVLSQGYTVSEMVTYLLSDNPSDAQMEYEAIIIGNAVEYFCPEYLNQIG